MQLWSFFSGMRYFWSGSCVHLIMEKGNGCCFSIMTMPNLIVVLIAIIVIFVIRILFVIHQSRKPLHNLPPKAVSTLIVLGSGGHTAEMINLIRVLQMERFTPRVYVVASTDNMSLQKAQVLEASMVDQAGPDKLKEKAQFMQIYRSREVGQSYLTSIWTTLVALVHALLLMIKIRPQVILCNGPGTCFPLCVIAFVFKVLGIRWSSIFYVESIARVKRLSLSGLLLYKLHIADLIFVQWPHLQKKYPRTLYVGCLM
ncbi:UDP-N-acetylglucosamine transferase subunit ALG14-like isoform X1 [Papaver somniferum]|uniref:UDP-N-acetylglucosamine transferase subunit ALG14-like isoform X1 n=1 Tax=Papaver somniferum TaxID=3469 RepID=UPI000E6FF489|nr:UDP-N-acetylglucosamine transferase subunit ALG14-like isoform X1 [Papaver somniferum]